MIGIYARLAATMRKLTGASALRRALSTPEPYGDASELQADLAIIETSLRTHRAASLVAIRLGPLRRAIEIFGFHLATLDLRQSSDKHEETLAELLAVARAVPDYKGLDETRKKEVLLDLLRDPRPLRIPGARYSKATEAELAILETARDIRASFGNDAIRHYIISHAETVSDLLEVLLLQKECGMMQGVLGDQNRVAGPLDGPTVRDDCRFAQCRTDHA